MEVSFEALEPCVSREVAAVLTLYWFWSFNPQKVRLALEEMALDYSLVTVDLAQGGAESPLIGQLNPNRKVPILVWDDYRLWESNAILTYLGERTGQLWPAAVEGKGDAARWLFFEARHLSEPIGELWFNGWLKQKRGKVPDTMAMSRAEKVSARYLAVLEAHVAERDWMLGESFSLVDCCYGPVLDAYALAGSYIDAYPAIKAYLGRMRARPSWKRCAFMS
jgi:glutathione S-transferase